jgi:hypothetical protein
MERLYHAAICLKDLDRTALRARFEAVLKGFATPPPAESGLYRMHQDCDGESILEQHGATGSEAGRGLRPADGTHSPVLTNSSSCHDGRWLFRVRHSETFERGHTAELLVCCDKHSCKAGSLKPERDRELQRIERAESFGHTVLEEQLPGAAKMLVVHGSHQETAAAQVGLEAPSCDQHRLLVDLANSFVHGKHRFHFYDGKARDETLGTRLGKYSVDESAACLLTVELGQGACVEEVSGQSTLLPLVDYRSRQGAMDRR